MEKNDNIKRVTNVDTGMRKKSAYLKDKPLQKAVVFDRDGTINSDEGHYYIYKPADFVFNPGVLEGMKRLQEAGAAAVMPLGAPIGTNKGVLTRELINIIIEQAVVPVVVDAGLGAPSHAAEALEMGADAVLVNTAIAAAGDPASMAEAFALACRAGRMAHLAGLPAVSVRAAATSPLTSFLH